MAASLHCQATSSVFFPMSITYQEATVHWRTMDCSSTAVLSVFWRCKAAKGGSSKHLFSCASVFNANTIQETERILDKHHSLTRWLHGMLLFL